MSEQIHSRLESMSEVDGLRGVYGAWNFSSCQLLASHASLHLPGFGGLIRLFTEFRTLSDAIVAELPIPVLQIANTGSGPLSCSSKVDADLNIEQISGIIDVQLEGATLAGATGSATH